MNNDDASQAVFGMFDGMVSVVGVVVGLAAHSSQILAATVGLAVASAIGMGAGEYLADPESRLRLAAVMAGATCAGTSLPVVPFALGAPGAIWWTFAVTFVLGVLVAHFRPDHRWPRAYIQTLGLLGVAAAATAAVTIVGGAT